MPVEGVYARGETLGFVRAALGFARVVPPLR
jgi:hypothetical protein